jgi:hypothetical protein
MSKLRVTAAGILLGTLALTFTDTGTAATPGNCTSGAPAQCFSSNPSTITYLEEDGNASGALGQQSDSPYVFVQFATKPNATPACAKDPVNTVFMLDPNMSPNQSKAMTALLTSAFLAGKTVRVTVAPTCTTLGDPGNDAIILNVVVTSGT